MDSESKYYNIHHFVAKAEVVAEVEVMEEAEVVARSLLPRNNALPKNALDLLFASSECVKAGCAYPTVARMARNSNAANDDFFPKDDFFSSLVFSSKGVVSSRPHDFSAKTIVTERCSSSRRREISRSSESVCVSVCALTQNQARKEIITNFLFSVGFFPLRLTF